MKLFTKQIDKQLFAQYAKGDDLVNQKVIAKIFNPYGKGVWYIINSDENDPDYLWAIVDLIEVEVGSVSREELETLKVPPFRLGLERDMSFTPINALEVYNGARSGKRYEAGGYMAKGGGVNSYEIYHETLSGALEEAENWVEKNGYSFVEANYFPDVTSGGISYGETKRFSRAITKKGKPVYSEGKLMIQIYRLDSGRYELNLYPSYEGGGSLEDENKQMLLNQAEGFEHHANELESAVKKADHVPAWVVAKSQRATTDLSDITHYLDGENEQKREMEEGEEMASGGYMAKGGGIDDLQKRMDYHRDLSLELYPDGVMRIVNGFYGVETEKGLKNTMYIGDEYYQIDGVVYKNDKPTKLKLSNGGYMAKGGEIKIIGDAITDEFGLEKNDVITERDVLDVLRKQKNRLLLYKGKFVYNHESQIPNFEQIISDLKKDGWNIVDTIKMASGGYMAKGGGINYVQGKDYMSGDGWSVYADKDGGGLSIKVDYSSGWSIDPHRYLGQQDVLRLQSNGKLVAQFTLPKGGISLFDTAKKLHDIAQNKIGQNKFSISEYNDILTLYFDMQIDYQKRQKNEGGYMAKGGEIFTYPNRINEDYDSVNKKWIKEPFTIREGQLIRYKHSPLGSCEAKFLTKVGDKAKIEILEDYEPRTNSEYNEWSGSDEPFGKFKKKVKRGTIKTVNVDKISIVNEDYFKPFQGRTTPISKMLYSPEFKEAFSHLDNKAEGGYMAKGGEIKVDGRTIKLKYVKRCCPSIKSDGTVGNYQYEFTDEQGNPFIGYGNSKQEALESIEKYLNAFKKGGYMAKGGQTNDFHVIVRTNKGLIRKNDFEDMSKNEIIGWCEERGWKYNSKGEKMGGRILEEWEFYVMPNKRYDVKLPSKKRVSPDGYMAKGGGVEKPYIVWVSKDGKKRERYGDYKSQRAAKMALDKIWKSGEDYVEIGYVSKEEFDKYGYFASGGKVTFDEKVSAVKSSLLKRKKVSPKVQKDYGKTYSPKEAEASAKRIVGAMTAKERLAAKLKKGKK